MEYHNYPLTVTDLQLSEIEVAIGENQSLLLQPDQMETEVPISGQHKLVNLNGTIAIASGSVADYEEAMSVYRKEFDQLADEATEELVSQFLGSGQDYDDMLRDLKRHKEKQLYNKEAAFAIDDGSHHQQLEKIWNDKTAWCDKAIEIAAAASWLYSHFRYGEYCNYPPYCQIVVRQ